MNKILASLTTLILLTITLFAAVGEWKVDSENAKIKFVIKNAGLNVDGSFEGLAGTVRFDKDNPSASSINLSVKAETIQTGIDSRDGHLRGEKYLEVDKYPNIRFKSTSVTSNSAGYLVTGQFTVHGVTQTVEIPFSFEGNKFKGEFQIDRLDYGVGKSSWIMSNKVKISFEIPVTKSS